jgi:hypothetical protein
MIYADISDNDKNPIPLEGLETVFSSKEFGSAKNVLSIRLKRHSEKKENNDKFTGTGFLKKIAANFIMIMLITAVIMFIIIIIFKTKNSSFIFKSLKIKDGGSHTQIHETAAGMLTRAQIAYKNGNFRDAWSSCFNCAITVLSEAGVKFPSSATEYECLHIIAKYIPSIYAPFESIVENRVNIAYRSKYPEESCFESSVNFCQKIITEKIYFHDGAKNEK